MTHDLDLLDRFQTEELTQEEASKVLGYAANTLKKWRRHDVGGGPRYIVKKDRQVRYRWCDLWEWLKANIDERGGRLDR